MKMLSIILVEDDVSEWQKYKEIINNREDVQLVSITNSSIKAIEDCKKYMPDAVILDLELNDGEGSGFDFIEKIKEIELKVLPKIVVTTNVHSDSVYDFCHKNSIDFIFYKGQKNYSREKIINTLFLLNDYENNNKTICIEQCNKQQEDNIMIKVNRELDNIGIGTHLTGRKYLADAIAYMLTNEDNSKVSIIQKLVAKYKKSSSTISRAMQNAILHAWRIMSIEDLNKYYTARVNYETGVPTPNELIYYYVDKIKKEL